MSRVRPRQIRPPLILHPAGGAWTWWLGLGVLALAVGVAWTAFEYGRSRAGFDAAAASAEQAQAREQLIALQARLQAQRQAAANQALDQQVMAAAVERARVTIRDLQAAQAGLEHEVAMLRGLLSGSSPLYVRDLVLQAGDDARRYAYRLTVVQTREDIKRTTGRLTLEVSGRRGDEPASYGLAELTADATAHVPLRFVHFQEVAGMLSLPPGFVPEALQVVIDPGNKGLETVRADWPWPAAERPPVERVPGQVPGDAPHE